MHLPRTAIERLAADDPDVWRRISHIMASHLERALGALAGMALDTNVRVAMALRRLAGAGAKGWAVVAISQQELGSITGLSRSAIRPIMTELEAANLVYRRYRRIEIPDLQALTRYVRASAPTLGRDSADD